MKWEATMKLRRTMASVLEDFLASGFVNVVGGCCGTTPDHIKLNCFNCKKLQTKNSGNPGTIFAIKRA